MEVWTFWCFCSHGVCDGVWFHNLCGHNAALYQLSYAHMVMNTGIGPVLLGSEPSALPLHQFTWRQHPDSNWESWRKCPAFAVRCLTNLAMLSYKLWSFIHCMVDHMRFELICYLVCQTSGHPKQPHSPYKKKIRLWDILLFCNASHRRITCDRGRSECR